MSEMTIKEMLMEYLKGCSCDECTNALITAIENKVINQYGIPTPEVIDYIPQSETTKHYKGAIGDMNQKEHHE